MKKLIIFAAVMCGVCFASCGNGTKGASANDSIANDTVDTTTVVADSVVADSVDSVCLN